MTRAVTYVTLAGEFMNRTGDTGTGHGGSRDAESLARTTLFTGVPRYRIVGLLQKYRFGIRECEDGQIIRVRGEEYTDLLLVLRGSLEAQIDDLAGHVLRVETLPAGSVVASAILFADLNFLPVTIRAMGNVRLAVLSRTTVLALAREEETILSALLRDMGNRAAFLAEKLRLMQFASIEEKLAVYLIDQADRAGCQEFDLPHTKRELAEIFGVTRPSLSRVFLRLCEESIISQQGRHVTIHDPEELREIAENVAE